LVLAKPGYRRVDSAEKDCRKRLDRVQKLENPDEDKKDIVEGHGEEEEDEDEDYVPLNLTAEDSQERQGSQKSPPSLVEILDAIGSANAREEKGNQQKHQEDRPSSVGSVLSESSSIASSTSSEFGDDDLEELENTMFIISSLRSRLDEFFPIDDQGSEPTMIFHNDLSRHNILVDKKGVLTGVVGWECVSALLLWIACQLPPVLQGKPFGEEPMKSKYQYDKK
jgi:hypothetical protein